MLIAQHVWCQLVAQANRLMKEYCADEHCLWLPSADKTGHWAEIIYNLLPVPSVCLKSIIVQLNSGRFVYYSNSTSTGWLHRADRHSRQFMHQPD